MNFNLTSLFSWSKKSQTTQDLYKTLLGLSTSKSGLSVEWKQAIQVTTFFACARVIADGLAQVPFKLNKEIVGGKGSEPAKDHPLYEVLHLKPNEWQTSYELREQIGLHLAVKFNAYIFKVRGLRGEIVELLPFEPDQVRVVRDGWSRKYEVYIGNGKKIDVKSDDMWHIRGPSWSGVEGLDAVRLAREAIGLALATEEHGARMFGNGARPSGILSTDSVTLKKEQVDALRESWESTQGGNANAYKTAILSGGLKWQSLAMNGVDSQHLEQRRFQVEEVCRGARVMPIMVGHSDKAATYASAEQMFLAHVVHTMMPWYARIEQSAAVNLLSKEERAQGYFPKFNVNGLMRGTFKDRSEFYTKMFNVGSMNPNEIRGFEDMNPYEGGDTYRVPLNTADPASIQENNINGDVNE